MGNLNRVIYLTNADYQTLIDNGTITKNGRTIVYNENDLYVTPGDPILDEYSAQSAFPSTGEEGRLYVAVDSNLIYRWDANEDEYVELSASDGYLKVDKVALDDAGISARTYTELFGGEFGVTTATTSGYNSPYARASVTGRISKHYLHRVTFNDTEYILPTRLWFSNSASSVKVYEYLGNIGLYISSTSGVPGGTDNVPFVIISDLNNSSSIDVLTSTAGSYTFKVEQITPTQKMLPPSLIYKDDYVPILKNNNGGTYNGYSIGVNELSNTRGTMAFGYGNIISDEFSNAFGNSNIISGKYSTAFGIFNNITGSKGFAFGSNISVTGSGSIGLGYSTIVNAERMLAIGQFNAAVNTNWPAYAPNTLYKRGDMVIATAGIIEGRVLMCKTTHISANDSDILNDLDSSGKTYWSLAISDGDTLFVIGNGLNNSNRSNALKIDLVGNGYFGGDIFVNCDADSTNGTKLATINEVVTDVQVNGTSVVSNGVANIPYATGSTPGVVLVNSTYSALTQWTSPGDGKTYLLLNLGNANDIKDGSSAMKPISVSRQHEAVFYGLAKAAGDTTQSASSNAVGAYTDSAKASIKSMLGVVDGSTAVIEVTGTVPTIIALENTRYICGEVLTLDVTPPASGICIIRFTSGSTPTVLTATGVAWPAWFDSTDLEANTVYEICITDGVYGVVMSWAL